MKKDMKGTESEKNELNTQFWVFLSLFQTVFCCSESPSHSFPVPRHINLQQYQYYH